RCARPLGHEKRHRRGIYPKSAKNKKLKGIHSSIFIVVVLCFFFSNAFSEIQITQKNEIPAHWDGNKLLVIHDDQKPFLYVASKEAGLKIYDLTRTPVLVKNITTGLLRGLEVMNVSQSGNYVYLALGNHFGIAQQNPGFAIIDVTNPA